LDGRTIKRSSMYLTALSMESTWTGGRSSRNLTREKCEYTY
jgi:hypothetical protein